MHKPLKNGLPPLIIATAVFCLSLIVLNDYTTLAVNNQQDLPEAYTVITLKRSTEIPLRSLQNLFGVATAKSTNRNISNIPKTRLNLTLAGTFTHKESNKASALIAESSKQSERYFVGEQVPGNAELVKVNTGSVVLLRNGQDELLSLPILQANSKSSSTNQKPNRPSNYSGSNESSDNISISRAKTDTNTDSAIQNNSLKDRLAQLRAKRNKSE